MRLPPASLCLCSRKGSYGQSSVQALESNDDLSPAIGPSGVAKMRVEPFRVQVIKLLVGGDLEEEVVTLEGEELGPCLRPWDRYSVWTRSHQVVQMWAETNVRR